MTALSKRLVGDEMKRGTLTMVRLPGWPLRRAIRMLRLKDGFESKALRQFLELARRRLRDATFASERATASGR